jgi:hypothetical protein
MSGGHGHLEGSNKNIAILIAVLAALLAIAEMGAKSSQTAVLTEHVEATNQWAFFQAKTVRQTVIRTAAEELEAQFKDAGTMPAEVKARSRRGARQSRATTASRRPTRGARSWRPAPRPMPTSARSRARPIIFSNTDRRRSSSPSCWRQRQP